MNTRNWELLDTLIHDDFGPAPMNDYITEITRTGINPWIEFLKILGYDDNSIIEEQNSILKIKDKQTHINWIKLSSQYMSNVEIQDIIAETNRVWVYTNSIFLTSNQRKLNHSGFTHFIIKDSKIIALYGAGRFLGSLIQMGKVIIAENDKEAISNYLQALRNLGILPDNMEMTPII
ncbi:MAG: hypothetical protein ACXAD7_07825 [Candidatus Kariarchaeaceae archaeon]